jgi:hypothetical protein
MLDDPVAVAVIPTKRQRSESKEGEADEHVTVDRSVQLRSRRIDRLNRNILLNITFPFSHL